MKSLQDQIQEVIAACDAALISTHTQADLEKTKADFIGRSGRMVDLMAQLKTLSLEEKQQFGPLLNGLKQQLQEKFTAKEAEFAKKTLEREQQKLQSFDVTAYKPGKIQGSLHIYTQLIAELEDIFMSMGFEVVDGPELETDYYNFQALNIPETHPARDMHDTFWVSSPGMLLRTHTSNVQAHVMQTHTLPLAVFAPGRCYRNEATDATHDFMFTQGECVVIDKNISMGNLLATAKTFLQRLFGKTDLEIRVRPGYFPFVEPGVEIDASCPFCKNGCSFCKKTGWIELLGSGLIHPNVLRANGINPDEYRGFAFGFGIERLAMIKYGINDIRLFRSGKIRFLNQF